ncbi:MAG: nucleotidyltransferase family protein [Hyphomicrobiales bacterium]
MTALNGVGIEPVLIKGAQSLWTGSPEWRYQIDLDLLIAENEAHSAQEELIKIGYGPDPELPKRDHRHHLEPLFRQDMPACIEIHRRAGNRYAEPLLPTAELLREGRRSEKDGLRVRLLPPHLHMLQALIHPLPRRP